MSRFLSILNLSGVLFFGGGAAVAAEVGIPVMRQPGGGSTHPCATRPTTRCASRRTGSPRGSSPTARGEAPTATPC
ncbi:MAG: hypothetical protein FWH21_09375 [Kiritimatiellaeota bacterium]|nr:hypothetical protein [Kiritimatiellota bacterium]